MVDGGGEPNVGAVEEADGELLTERAGDGAEGAREDTPGPGDVGGNSLGAEVHEVGVCDEVPGDGGAGRVGGVEARRGGP